MIDVTDSDALDALINSRIPREYFGPASDMYCLALDLGGTKPEHAAWLIDLPCPVIGIGKGALAQACDVILPDKTDLDRIVRNVARAPLAAMMLVQHLRASGMLGLQDALTAESFAYAAVQKGPDFLQWLESYSPPASKSVAAEDPLLLSTKGKTMELVLNDPDNLNSIGVQMRDALCAALDLALADDSHQRVSLSGAGRCFSAGGEVAEFGEIADPATAHWIRSLRLPAWRLARLQDRLHVHVNGAAVGAGAEIAAFGHLVTATKDAWFQLPELKYGLIPGAGGTASLPRRIGRQRTAYMALSMKRIKAQTALDWGLVDMLV